MNTNSLLAQLSYGELSNLSLSNEGDGSIRPRDMGKLLTFINDGLSDITNKFRTKESIVHIKLYEHITTYVLDSKYSVVTNDPSVINFPYVLDNTREPFKNDVKKIMSVEDSLGRDRPINDTTTKYGVFIKEKNKIEVPLPEAGVFLFIKYQSEHFRVTTQNLDEDLDINDSLIPALRIYVAYKVFSTIGTVDASNKSIELLNQYMGIVQELRDVDITGDSKIMDSNFRRNGWI